MYCCLCRETTNAQHLTGRDSIGQVFHAVPDSITRGLPLDDYVAIASFLYFGVKSLLDAFNIEDDGAGIAEEREEAAARAKADADAKEAHRCWPALRKDWGYQACRPAAPGPLALNISIRVWAYVFETVVFVCF